jgi:hypothetical protein
MYAVLCLWNREALLQASITTNLRTTTISHRFERDRNGREEPCQGPRTTTTSRQDEREVLFQSSYRTTAAEEGHLATFFIMICDRTELPFCGGKITKIFLQGAYMQGLALHVIWCLRRLLRVAAYVEVKIWHSPKAIESLHEQSHTRGSPQWTKQLTLNRRVGTVACIGEMSRAKPYKGHAAWRCSCLMEE